MCMCVGFQSDASRRVAAAVKERHPSSEAGRWRWVGGRRREVQGGAEKARRRGGGDGMGRLGHQGL